MAVDTAAKRYQMMNFGDGSTMDVLPIPDGTIAIADRQHLLDCYGGIAFGAPAAAAADTGQHINIQHFVTEPAGTAMIRFSWRLDSTSKIHEWMTFPITGTLLRYSFATIGGTPATATWGATLKDVWGRDMLGGSVATETVGASDSRHLTTAISTLGDRPVITVGRHLFEYAGHADDNDNHGVLELHYESGFLARQAQVQLGQVGRQAAPACMPHAIIGTATVINRTEFHDDLRVVEVHWTSDAGGTVHVTGLPTYGYIDHVTTVPDASAAPTDNYDVVLQDDLGIDLLGSPAGQLANRDTANSETVYPHRASAATTRHQEVLSACCGTLVITNAGANKRGKIAFHVLALPE